MGLWWRLSEVIQSLAQLLSPETLALVRGSSQANEQKPSISLNNQEKTQRLQITQEPGCVIMCPESVILPWKYKVSIGFLATEH